MKNRSVKQDFLILFACFLISRVIINLLGVHFGYNALYEYWQYLDITSLKTNLLQSLWYMHAQPPAFNFLLGIILKISGSYNLYFLEALLLVISLCNGFLLLKILYKIAGNSRLPIIIAVYYIVSPATMLYENELFYTTFISLLLLLAVYFMILLAKDRSLKNLIAMFLALVLACLTRSMYHLLWITAVSGLLMVMYFGRNGFKRILIVSLLSISIVGGWYFKNYVIFGNFSASSWVGINFARIVFHDTTVTDTSNIASIHPFMPISYYQNFITNDYKKNYAGLNDTILLAEKKNGFYINMNNAGYREVSKQYAKAGIKEVQLHPKSYLKNVGTAFIIFFTSASSYFKVAANEQKIKYYDMVFSLNPAYFFSDTHAKKASLAVAAVPRFLLYFFTIFFLIRTGVRAKTFSFFNIFIIATILFSLLVGSLLDYGENMRFRYEIEPLFLVMLAQVIGSFRKKSGS